MVIFEFLARNCSIIQTIFLRITLLVGSNYKVSKKNWGNMWEDSGKAGDHGTINQNN